MKKYLKKIITILIIVIIAAIVSGFFSIYFTVWKTCDSAKKKYKGSCQNALIAVLEDNNATPKEKNDAIWALGQMADPESLSVLEKFYSGSVPKGREPLDEVVSQYEIKKAIRWCKNGNATSWMYWGLK